MGGWGFKQMRDDSARAAEWDLVIYLAQLSDGNKQITY